MTDPTATLEHLVDSLGLVGAEIARCESAFGNPRSLLALIVLRADQRVRVGMWRLALGYDPERAA